MEKFLFHSSAVLLSLWSGISYAENHYNLPPPATITARQIYDLHTLILLVCVVIFVIVFAIMFYSIYKHRKSVGHQAEQFHQHKALEIVWSIIPFLILAGMAYPATKVILDMKDTSAPDMSIKITGAIDTPPGSTCRINGAIDTAPATSARFTAFIPRTRRGL